MWVRDDGVGIPKDIDIDKAHGLGLKITRTIIQDQLRGKLEVKRYKGTEVIMQFKILPED